MSRPGWRAAGFGVLVAVVLGGIVVGLVVSGAVSDLVATQKPDQILVIAGAPDAEGATVATVGFVLSGTELSPIDMERRTTITGTSAKTPRSALPFGGGELVARAVAVQTGGEVQQWVAIAPPGWTALIDDAGGLEVVVPTETSAYQDGSLTVLDAGRAVLSGDEVLALLSAVDYMTEAQARQVADEVGAGLAEILRANPELLAELVEADTATSSVPERFLGGLFAEP